MAIPEQIYVDVDLHKNQLLNPSLHRVTVFPSNPVEGQLCYLTKTLGNKVGKLPYYFDGINWKVFNGAFSIETAGDVFSVISNTVDGVLLTETVTGLLGKPLGTLSTGYLKYNGTNWVFDNTATGGTVTSVGLSVPSIFTVSGSPVTTSGNLGFTWNGSVNDFVLADGSVVARSTYLTVANAITTYQPLATNLTTFSALGNPASNGYVLSSTTDGTMSWIPVVGGGGTVTSVGLSAPSIFTVSGSPVATNGTLSFAWNGSSTQLVRGDGSTILQSSLQPSHINLTSLSNLSNPISNAHLMITSTGVMSWDTTNYLSSITLTGDVTGNGSSSISTTVVKVNGASIPVSAVLLGTNASSQLIALNTLPTSAEPAHVGDVTNPAGSLTLTISAGAVSLSKMANLPANTIIGNNTGSSSTPIALTISQVKALLGITYSDVSGISATLPITYSSGIIAHSTVDGYLHVPATGTTNSGKWLRAGATAGSASWQYLVAGDLPSHTHTASQISDSTVIGRSILQATDAAAARSALSLTGWATKAYTNGSTTDVSEGSNLYYTDARARAAITATSPIIAAAGVISHSTADGNLHVPATGTTSNGKWLRAGSTPGSVSWQTLDLPSHTHSSNAISDSTVLGRQLLTIADAPAARYALFLTEWATKSYTNGSTTDVAEGSNLYYTDARARAAITAASPIIATAGVISHSATDGNLHVPATGTTNNGKWLRAGATPGSISWQSLVVGDLPSHTHTASQISDSTTIGRSLLLAADAAAARSAIALTGWATKTYTNGSTTDVSEGSNLYYTDARARAAITATSPIIATAGVISHSAADGNLHVPATGTTNNGKWLRAGATAGSASWQSLSSGDLPIHASLHHWNGADPLAGQSIAGLLTSSVPQFAGLLLTGNIRVNQDTLFAANSVDGNEQSALAICGGLGSSASNGAFVYVRGNERPSSGGTLSLVAGDGIQGNIEFSTGTLLRASITKAGEFNVSSGAFRIGSITGFLAATSGLVRAGTASDLPGSVATLGSLANGNGVLLNTGAGVLSWQACLPIQSYSTLGIARASGTSVYAYQILADTGIGFGDARGLNWRGGFFGNQPDWWGFRQDASLTSSFKPFVIGDYLSDLYTIDRFGSYVHLLNGTARITTSLSIGSLTGILKADAGLVSVASAGDLPVHATRHHFGSPDPISGQLLSGLRVTEAPKFAGLVLENLVSDSAYLRFHDSSGALRHQIRRFSNANGGGLAFMDGGSGFRITIPSLGTLPVEIDGGVKLFSGDLTLNTSFNGILKAAAGVVSVASLSDIPIPAGRIPFGGAAGMTSDPGLRFGDPAPNILYAPYLKVESMLYASLFNLGSSAAFVSMGDTVLAIGDGVIAPRVRFPVTSTSKAFQVDGLATFANIDAVQVDADLVTGDVQPTRDEIESNGSRTLPQANQVGKSVRFCAGIGPGTYTVSVFNPATELIFYRSRTTGVRTVATSLDVVDSATEFVCHAVGRWTAVGY